MGRGLEEEISERKGTRREGMREVGRGKEIEREVHVHVCVGTCREGEMEEHQVRKLNKPHQIMYPLAPRALTSPSEGTQTNLHMCTLQLCHYN